MSRLAETIRIGITTPNEREQERVVNLPAIAEEHVNKIEQAIVNIFEEFDVDENPELRLAILARISKKLMQESEK